MTHLAESASVITVIPTINLSLMKKYLFTLVAVMTILTTQAQSICGAWRSMERYELPTGQEMASLKGVVNYIFNQDNSYYCIMEVLLVTQEEAVTEMVFNIGVKGSYVLDGDQLTLTTDKNSFSVDLINISNELGNVPVIPNIKKEIENHWREQLRGYLVKAQDTETYTVKCNDSSLAMTDKSKKTDTYKRLKSRQER